MTFAPTPRIMPFPGLRPFEEKDDPIFFGRNRQVHALLRELERNRFVAVVGASGCGKSSLVRAGLLPAVRRGFLHSTTQWATVSVWPGASPYENLEEALRPFLPPANGAKSNIAETLRWTDRGLLKVLPKLNLAPGTNLLLLVDQFEELFSYRHGGTRAEAAASRHECSAFVSMLLATAEDAQARMLLTPAEGARTNVWIVITMRSDFIGECEAFLGLPEKVSKGQFLVPRLDSAAIREAIVRPSLLAGGGFEPFTVPEELVNVILGDAGDRPDQLPLMQHALMRTWKFGVCRAREMACPILLTAEDYQRVGRIDDALSRHAEDAWNEIPDDERMHNIARRLFLLLCDVALDGKIARRRPEVSEVMAVTGATLEEIRTIVRLFQDDDRNFLLPPKEKQLDPDDYLDVSHEALLRQWKRFADEWLVEERADAAELRRLAELAMLSKQGQDVGLLSAQYLARIALWRTRVSAEWAARYIKREEWDAVEGFILAKETAAQEAEAERQKEAEKREAEKWRKEQEKVNRRRLLTGGLLLVFFSLCSLALAIYASHSRDLAKTAAETAGRAAASAKHAVEEAKASEARAKESEAEASRSATDASAHAEAALKARNAADGLIHFMQFDLSAKLQPLGKLDLMGDVAQHILEYQKSFPAPADDPEAERSANLALSQYGDVLLAQGRTTEALEYLNQSAQRLEKMAAADHSLPNVINWANGLSKIGAVQLQRKEVEAAKASFGHAYDLIDSAVKGKKSSRDAQQAMARVEMQLGDAAFAGWELDPAHDWYTHALDLRKSIAAGDETCDICQREVAESLNKKGAIEKAQGDIIIARGEVKAAQDKWRQAHASLAAAVTILRSLTAEDPADTPAQSELSKALGNEADLALVEYWADPTSGAKLKAAQKFVDECFEIRRRLTQQDQTNVDWQRDLWNTLNDRGEVYRALGGPGGLDTALESYILSLEIAVRLSDAAPGSDEFQSFRAGSLEGVGDIYKSEGETLKAMEHYDLSRRIWEKLAKKEPTNSGYRGQWAMLYASMADALEQQRHGNLADAQNLIDESLNIIHAFDPHDPVRMNMQPQFEWIKQIAAKIKKRLEPPSMPTRRHAK